MAQEADLLIKINADGSNADEVFKNLQKQTDKYKLGLSEITKVSAVAFAATTAGLGYVIKAAADAEQSTIRLSNALHKVGQYSDEARDAIVKDAHDMAETSKFSYEEIADSIATLTRRTHDYHVAVKYEQAIIDLATEKQLDLATATKMVGQAYNGNLGLLARSGIVLAQGTKGIQALEAVSQQFAGSSKQWAASTDGQLALAQKAIKELAEEIGMRFLPEVTKIASGVKDVVKQITEWDEKSHGIIGTVMTKTAAIAGLMAGMGFLIPKIIEARNMIIALNVALGANPALAVAAGITALTVALTSLGVAVAANYSKQQGDLSLTKNMITQTEQQIRQRMTNLSLMKVGTAEYTREAAEVVKLHQKLVGLTALEKNNTDAAVKNAKKKKDAVVQGAAEENEAALQSKQTWDIVTTGINTAFNKLGAAIGTGDWATAGAAALQGLATAAVDAWAVPLKAKMATDIASLITPINPAAGAAAAAAVPVDIAQIAGLEALKGLIGTIKINPKGAAEGIYDFRASGNNEKLLTTLDYGESIIPKSMTDAVKSGELSLGANKGGSKEIHVHLHGDTIGINSNDIVDRLTKKLRAGIQSNTIPMGRLSGSTT